MIHINLIIASVVTSILILYSNLPENGKSEVQQKFTEWKETFGLSFTEIENLYRYEIFYQNLQMINHHNQNENVTYQMAINQFMHLTKDQFASLYLLPENEFFVRDQPEFNETLQQPLKASIDYRNFTIIKEQGQCAGWPFSVTGTIEVYQRIYQSRNVSLSEQQLIDCDTLSRGCTSGSNINGYKYAITYGLANSSEYPYVGYNQTCKRQYGTYNIKRYNSAVGEYSMKQALNHHPVSAGLDAQNWQFYSSGVFSNCGITLNHYAVVVGYEETGDWILKNSWGATWGEKGFIRIKSGNTCGVLSYAYQDQY